jgi:hypothetical protein
LGTTLKGQRDLLKANLDKVTGERDGATAELSAMKLAQAEARVTALLNGAVKAGKIAPAGKEAALAMARADVAKFEVFLGTLPAGSAVPLTEIAADQAGIRQAPLGAVTDAQRKMCEDLGVSEAAFLKA